jgi:DNA-binding FrmR family transcriptional regulator
MVEASRPCSELMMQISSTKAALHHVGAKIFEAHLRNEFQLTALDTPAQLDENIKGMLSILSRIFK